MPVLMNPSMFRQVTTPPLYTGPWSGELELEFEVMAKGIRVGRMPVRWSRVVCRWEAKHVGRPRLGQGTGIRCWCPTCGAECQITGVGRYQRVVSRCSCPPTVAS